MAKCSACGKYISAAGAASCTTCTSVYHKGCVAIPDATGVPKDWICPDCKKKIRKGDNSSTPVKGIYGGETPAQISKTLTAPTPPSEESDISAMRRELSTSMTEFRDFLKEFRSTVLRMEERMNDFGHRLEAVERRQVEAPPVGDDVAELRRTIEGLKSELNIRDQEMLLSDLDIGHLPEEKGVSPLHTVTVLAAKLGVTLEARDIVFAERVGVLTVSPGGGTEARPRRVIVRLARRELRDELLRAARVRRNINAADVGLAGPSRRIYINERLTATNRRLFQRVREECRKRGWRYSWTKKGRIFARQDDGKQVQYFRSESDLDRVFQADAVTRDCSS